MKAIAQGVTTMKPAKKTPAKTPTPPSTKRATKVATSTAAQKPGLADALQQLYDETRVRMGEEDLVHIRRVAAYSKAIKARSQELILRGGKKDALKRGIVLYALHVLLEFSELGHNIMHGGYDNIPGAGEFHSDHWQWDFVTDVREWKVMHHQNHHPFTSIVGKDHDLGYSFARLSPQQDWYGHHAAQPAVFGLLLLHVYHFSVYTATSAARVEDRPVLSLETFRQTFSLIGRHALKNYVQEPLQARSRFLHTLIGNYLGTALGYDLTILILALEHHAPNVQLFADPGPTESREDYFRRQILGTTNFVPMRELDEFCQRILSEEVDFEDPPEFDVFYGGLTTHLEHHLFPDMPCNRQREIVPQVRALCTAHGLPYNMTTFEEVVPNIAKNLIRWVVPVNEAEQHQPLSLLRTPRKLLNRIWHGLRYSSPSPTTYFKAPRYFNASAKILAVRTEADGQALSLSMRKPDGWDEVKWDAGAYVSVRVTVNGESLVRQYSLTSDSINSKTLDITIKRVAGGRVSNFLNDHSRPDQFMTLVGVPQNDGSFIMRTLPARPVLIAGGVGITPIISMMRKLEREAPATPGTLIYFNRNPESIIFEQSLRAIAHKTGMVLHFICDEVPTPHEDIKQDKLSRELLTSIVSDLANTDAYVCAPPGFIKSAKNHLLALGLRAENFHVESFSPPALIRPPSDGRQHKIRFLRSGLEIIVDGATTLLEAARMAGLHPPTGCEQGLCKACACNKISGQTREEEVEAKSLSRITVCNSLPRSDIDLDL